MDMAVGEAARIADLLERRRGTKRACDFGALCMQGLAACQSDKGRRACAQQARRRTPRAAGGAYCPVDGSSRRKPPEAPALPHGGVACGFEATRVSAGQRGQRRAAVRGACVGRLRRRSKAPAAARLRSGPPSVRHAATVLTAPHRRAVRARIRSGLRRSAHCPASGALQAAPPWHSMARWRDHIGSQRRLHSGRKRPHAARAPRAKGPPLRMQRRAQYSRWGLWTHLPALRSRARLRKYTPMFIDTTIRLSM